MKLVVLHYLRSLRERDELDAILPDLLAESGFEVLTRPRRGTRQAGVDVAAVGPNRDSGGDRSLFLFTIKSGDLTREHWDTGQQAVRPSLNEILDDYIPNRIPPHLASLPVVICVCMGGEMREDVRAQWSGFCRKNETVNIHFAEWNGDRLADLILSGMLRAELIESENRGLFQKALAMLDQPDVAYRYFSHLLNAIFTKPKDQAECTRQLRKAYLCLWILFVWARDADNLEAAYRASELVLLRSWPHCDSTHLRKGQTQQERLVHFDQVVQLHIIIARLLLVDKIGLREFNFEVQFPIKNQAAFRSSSKTTCGCLNPKHLRGLKFSRFSTADSASAVTTLKSLPLGTYCRSRPLLFSFCPRSHALYGCAKYTCASSSAATRSCSTNSLPLSAVMVWTCAW